MFQGKAASDLDIDLFLANLRTKVGKPELNSLGRTIIPVSGEVNQNAGDNLNEFGEIVPQQANNNNAENVLPMEELKLFKLN